MAHGRGRFERLAGIWRSHGYGTLLEIDEHGYRLYEETAVSCLPVFAGTLADLADHYVDVRVSRGRQAFSARRATGVTRVRYRRLSRRPVGCVAPQSDLATDPVHAFDVFWHTFEERYVSFDLREVDWEAARAQNRPLVDAKTGARQLFEIFVEMLRPLRDGHVALHTPIGRFDGDLDDPAPGAHDADGQRRLLARYLSE